ncbi:hypothetical protein Lal_00003508 [Lupinus albus]|nr:hypothetical protein Lal_00003508 [Lupinus albus]
MKGMKKNLPFVIFSFLFILCTATVVEIRQGCPPEPPLDVVTRRTIPVDDQMRDLERLCFRSTCFCMIFPFLDSLCLLPGAYDVLGNEYKGPNWVSFLCHFSTVQAAGCKCGIVG